MRRYSLILLIVQWLSMSLFVCARLRVPPGEEDVRDLAQRAPLVFRGEVVQVDLTKNGSDYKEGIAVVAIDRWYSGGHLRDLSTAQVHFAYGSVESSNGHNCVDLVANTHWIFFAQGSPEEVLELADDCEGALAVSPLLAQQTSGGLLSQMEEDFRAGLGDSEPNSRLASIQRLAGLGLPSSREALRNVIALRSEIESKWAMFALLKTGDGSAVSLVAPMLITLHHTEDKPYPQPEGAIAIALEKLRDRAAVQKLIEILNGARDEVVRSCASQALMEIRDARALDSFAEHLSDSSQYVRYNSLIGMEYITHAPACTIAKPEDAEKAEPSCKAWWQSKN